jgi:AcrR family transcriptional regulator
MKKPRRSRQPRTARKRRRRPDRLPHGETKESLLDAAERLFALHGMQGVSLRTINAASGARNASAAHYHFQSRESLFKAVARRRMDKLSEERLELLKQVERDAKGGPPDLHAIVEAVTLPTFRMLLDDAGGSANYVRFLARAAADPTVRISELATESFNYVFMTALGMIHRALPHVPMTVLTERIGFGFDVGMLAPMRIDRTARRPDGSIDRDALEVFAARLVDYVVGALSSPVSTQRLALVEAPPKRRRASG